MNPNTVFSSKAEKYARYRWDYAPQAVAAARAITNLSAQSTLADIGAGSGILTRHFVGSAKVVIAIEPNPEMRRFAQRHLGGQPGVHVLAAQAEATALLPHSVDVISVATALNWFDPLPTRAEFRRIIKPGGWLVNFQNRATRPDFGPAMANLYPRQTDTHALMKGVDTPLSFYYGIEDFQQLQFPISADETWEQFFGALASASYAPDEDHPAYAEFERAARAMFNRFSQDGIVTIHGITTLTIGRLKAA